MGACLSYENYLFYHNISMILHTDTDIINLGLKRIHGTMPAEKCVELVIEKLKTFEINLDEHIVSVPSDAASVMCKFGKLIEKKSSEIISAGPIHILCANHGFHLCIMDVAYKIVAKNDFRCYGFHAAMFEKSKKRENEIISK